MAGGKVSDDVVTTTKGGELGRGGVRATGPVVESAVLRKSAPGMEARGLEAPDTECSGEGDGLLSGSDGGQDRTLGLTVWYPLRAEAKAGEANQEQGKADDGEEESDAPPEGEDFGLKFSVVQREDVGGDDSPRAAPNPADHSGTWNAEVMEKARVAFFADEVSHSVVVGTAPGGGRHGTW